MKMKKKIAVALMFVFALAFTLTGCQKTVVLPADFDTEAYSQQVQNITESAVTIDRTTLQILANEQEEPLKGLCQGTLTAMDEAGMPMENGAESLTYSMDGDNVVLTETYKFAYRSVDFEYTFEPNPAREYNPEAEAYNMLQIVVSANYTTPELLKQAGMNTLMGMGVVFCVLIFISVIIKLMEFLPFSGAAEARRTKKKNEEAKARLAESVKIKESLAEDLGDAPAAAYGDPMQDQELVAVITAAVMATYRAENNIPSTDPLVVRSIKRVSR